jgi:mitochondrial fission protein ELM1
VRIGNSALQANYAKLVTASSRSNQQRDLLQERRMVRSIQFDEKSDSEEESKNPYPDNFADYIVDLHS